VIADEATARALAARPEVEGAYPDVKPKLDLPRIFPADKADPIGHVEWSIAFGGGCFIATGNSGLVLSSQNGIAWTQRSPGTANCLSTSAYVVRTFLVAGQAGAILQSDPLPTAP